MATNYCRVPLEIAELVIDELSNDYPSLRSCALTCQAWLPRSRTHIFRTVHVMDLNRLTSLVRVLAYSADIARLVHYVDLEGVLQSDYSWRVDKCKYTSGIFDTAPLVLLGLLPNLRVWTCRGNSKSGQPYLGLRPAALACIGHHPITTLRLIQIRLRYEADLMTLLFALPALQSLLVRSITIGNRGTQLGRRLQHLSEGSLSLSSLEVQFAFAYLYQCSPQIADQRRDRPGILVLIIAANTASYCSILSHSSCSRRAPTSGCSI